MESANGKTVLVSGASIAGISTAYWLNKLGYRVTVVELAAEPRTGEAQYAASPTKATRPLVQEGILIWQNLSK